MNHFKKYIAAVLTLLVALSMTLGLAGCSKDGGTGTETTTSEEPYSKDVFAMDTYMTVSAYGEKGEAAVEAAVKEINRLDALLSTGKTDSEVSKLNKAGGGKLSEDTNALMEAALTLYDSTDHAFDITIYPVMKLWGFADGNFKVPAEKDLKTALDLVDAGALTYDAKKKTVTFGKEGMAIDFGGIAKGYTSARIAKLYKDAGVTSGLVNLGGNVQTVGLKPDGTEWKIGIQHPEDENDMLGVVETHDTAVITSGGYERNFEEDGVTYHHIIDPKTGYPAHSGLTSVTIVSKDGTLADGLSTSLFILGKERAIDYWQSHKQDFDFILFGEDGTLTVSVGLKDAFTPKDDTATVEYVD